MNQNMNQTRVFLVGAGPGSADLLTLKAARLLARADVVLYDALVAQDTLALATRAELIAVGKRAGQHSVPQRCINALLVEKAKLAVASNQIVVRLKGGDPLTFARAEEEMLALTEQGIAFEIVPGITSAQAAHAHIQSALTRRGTKRSFVIVTPQVQAGDDIGVEWARPLVAAGRGAVYMAASSATRIKGTLLALGFSADTPSTWVINAGAPDCCVIEQCLGNLQGDVSPSGAPVVLLINTFPSDYFNTDHQACNSLVLSALTLSTSSTSSASSPLVRPLV